MRAFAGWIVAAIALSAVAFFLSGYYNDVYRKLLLWIALALGYNFLFGISGQVAFSHFAFYGIGAYAVVIFLFQIGLPLPLAILAGILVCTAVALVVAIPSTRLEGFYLALATLALAQLFIVVLNEGGTVTGCTGGIVDYRLPPIFGARITGPWYTVVIVVVVLIFGGSMMGSRNELVTEREAIRGAFAQVDSALQRPARGGARATGGVVAS